MSSQKLFTVYVKDGCPYSAKALDLLKVHEFGKEDVKVVRLATKEELEKATGGLKTFPQVYFHPNSPNKKTLIGGYDKLEPFLKRYKEALEEDSVSGSDDDFSGSGSGSASDDNDDERKKNK